MSVAGVKTASPLIIRGYSSVADISVGLSVAFSSVLLTVHGGPLGLIAVAVGMSALAAIRPVAMLASLIFAIIFQNVFLSLLVDAVSTASEFRAGQAVNFILMASAAIAILVLNIAHKRSAYSIKVTLLSMTALFAIAVGSVNGLVRTDFSSVASYIRLMSIPVFAIVIGEYCGAFVSKREFRAIATVVGVMLCIWAIFESLWPQSVYGAFRLPEFFAWKTPSLAPVYDAEYLKWAGTRSWLNLSGDFGLGLSALRMYGPTIHPISYAYCAASVAAILLAFGSRILPLFLGLVVLAVGSKGALFLSLLPAALLVGSFSVSRLARPRMLFAVCGVYAALVLAYGMYTRDVHILGLIKGFSDFANAPFGHGIGVGGNLSAQNQLVRNYVTYQQQGVPFALESAVGVAVYQLGVLLIPMSMLLILVGRRLTGLWDRLECRLGLAAFIAVLINSLFQEEGFAPAAAGIVLTLASFLASQRQTAWRLDDGSHSSAGVIGE